MIKLKEFPKYPESFLERKCEPVASKEEAKELEAELLDNFPENGALAVALPQIGISKQAFMIDHRMNNGQYLFCCNPKIVEAENQIIFKKEGCLSFPGKRKNTVRFNRVKVTFLDSNFEEKTIIAENSEGKPEATMFQHEVDHLNGILIKDRTIKPSVGKKQKVGRNDKCPCGSGRKYKKCCIG